MYITKEEFQEWKSNDVTKAFFEAAQIRVQDTKDILAQSAGVDSVSDNFYRGFIQAYLEMQDFRVDDLVEGED